MSAIVHIWTSANPEFDNMSRTRPGIVEITQLLLGSLFLKYAVDGVDMILRHYSVDRVMFTVGADSR